MKKALITLLFLLAFASTVVADGTDPMPLCRTSPTKCGLK